VGLTSQRRHRLRDGNAKSARALVADLGREVAGEVRRGAVERGTDPAG
jgi:hypothetical protein